MGNTQLSLFGKTYPEHSAATKAKTSGASCKNSPPCATIPYLSLDLRGGGLRQARSWETVGPSHGASWTPNTGECPSVAAESHLSWILEDSVPEKYYLSPQACQGILNRAERRGKTAGASERCTGLAEGPLCGGFKGKASADSGTVEFEIDRCPTLIAGQVCHVVYDARGNGSGTIVPTLTGDHQNRVTDYTAICIMGNVIDRNANCNGAGWCRDVSYTLNTIDRHAVMCVMSSQEHAGMDDDLCGTLSCKHEQPVIVLYPVVRRLIPLECERLQGYPDGWTDIPDYIDSHGKRRKASDSARYTALGNSIALPQWRYVLGNISKYLPPGATLGSLFDGIGGFPLVWEEIHGKGTAVWASEINGFCIAVTKYRFGG